MTLSAQTPTITVQADGASYSFAYNFEVPYQDGGTTPAVLVYLALGPSDVVLLNPSTYTIAGVGNETGGFVTYPLAGPPLSVDYQIIITRNLAYTQGQSFPNTSLNPAAIESMGDRLAMQIQQLSILGGSGGGGTTGVSSFNARTGAVSLTASDVSGALGYTPVNKAGDLMGGPLFTKPSVGATAGLLLGVGTDPTTPPDGSIWNTAAGAFIRNGGATYSLLGGGGAVASVNGHTGTVVLAAADVGAIATSARGAANGVASLDGSGKVPSSQVNIHTPVYFTAASQAAMLALSSAVVGDYCVRTDNGETFVLTALPPSTLGNWFLFSSAAGVTSVNGAAGNVTLTPKTMGIMASLVQDFGAVADGSTDCTSNWNAAVAAINAGTIYGFWVPPGVMVLNGTTSQITKAGWSIRGTGSGACEVLVTGGSGPVINHSSTTGNGCININGFTFSTTQATSAGRTAMSVAFQGMGRNINTVVQIDDVNVRCQNFSTQGFNQALVNTNAIATFVTNCQWLSAADNSAVAAATFNATTSFYNIGAQFDNVYMQQWGICVVGNDHLEGFIFQKTLFDFVNQGIVIRLTDTTEAPYFEISQCQFQTVNECIVIDNASAVLICDNLFLINGTTNANVIEISNTLGITIHDNQYTNLGGNASFAVGGINLINVEGAIIHDEYFRGLTAIGVAVRGTSTNVVCRDSHFDGPVGSAYVTYADVSGGGAGGPTNFRTQGHAVGPTLDPGNIAVAGPTPGTQTITTTITVFASIGPVPVEYGDVMRFEAPVHVDNGSDPTQEIFVRIREYNHRPGTSNPYNILQFGYDKNFALEKATLNAGTSNLDAFFTLCPTFQSIARATDALFVLEIWCSNGTAILDYAQLRWVRE